jgi:ribonuclease HI
MQWVKGHADNTFNEKCDQLAVAAALGKDLLIDEGYEESV